jgi:protoheme IX farnesyltransferase
VTPATGTLPVVAGRRSARVVARSLFALTKPRIIELLLVTTIPTMLLAQRGLPSVRVLVVTLVGGAFAAGSANTINCYIDRDIDALMKRTSRRPLARKAPLAVVRPAEALVFGIVLGIASTLLLGTLVNWLSAVLADAAILFYVFVYTLGLKRRTPSNIVIGGAAGCFPVLIGWSAVTGTVSLPAVVLFAVIFFWTPPHFWALAMKFRDDYAAASVPMLPVVATPAVVARKILFYSYVMVAVTLGLAPYVGWIYTACAVGLGAWFLAEAHRLRGRVAAMPGAGDPGLAPPAGAQPAGAQPAGGWPAAGRPANAVPAGRWRDDRTGAGPADAGRTGVATAVDEPIAVDAAMDAAAGAAETAGNPGVTDGACAGLVPPSANPAPMRLFHLSIAYLTLLFAVIAVTAVLPWGSW